MKNLLFLGAFIFVLPVFADEGRVQDSFAVHQPHVIMDPDIKWLLEAHRKAMSRERGIPGFRVQVFMEAGNQARLNTQRSRAEFENKYPGINVYIVYEEPNFKLRVGDFRTRLDARRFLETIKEDYPSAYIVVSNINFPDLD
ncbi:MAG: SPOR domain-containing protein [Bacteroidales bacterium]